MNTSDKSQAKPKYEVGDWVRFYSGGKLVIGVVAYIKPPKTGFTNFMLMTDAGAVDSESVLERRSA